MVTFYPSNDITYTDSTWSSWNDTAIVTSTPTETTWYGWVIGTDQGAQSVSVKYVVSNNVWSTWLSKDDIKRQERANRHYESPRRFAGGLTDQEKIDLRAEKSENRAKELLLDLIGEDELKVYQETGRLFVKGKKFDYIIRRDKMMGGLERIEKNRITDLCVHLKENFKCPKTDNVIALKLAIESDEDKILELANSYSSHNRPDKLPKAACMSAL